jgi:DNA polymerase family A
MPERRSQTIDSIEAMQKVVPVIVKAVNDDQAFGLRAAANPLLAAEELGYQIVPEIRQTVERRVRFSQEDAARLGELETQVYKLAGVQFGIDSPQELDRVLFEKLKLTRPTSSQQASPDSYHKLASAPPTTAGLTQAADPLEELRNAHPIMPPLLEYRRIDRTAPRLAPRELYERIRSGEVKMPVTRIQARLKRSRTPK